MKPENWYIRILTSSTVPEVEARIRKTLETILDGYTCQVSPMKPYWKYEGWGELGAEVRGMGDGDGEAVKSRLAGKWEDDVADSRWSDIFDDAVMFLSFGEGSYFGDDRYCEVEILNTPETKEYAGRKGVILGTSEEDGILYGYGVWIDEEVVCFTPNQVEKTGVQFNEEDFYDGTHISVSVDGELTGGNPGTG
jgi:hypothetical protein